MSGPPREDRFEDFFAADFYVALKNSLYNYRLRQQAVRAALPDRHDAGRILEIGAGMSPILTDVDRVVYSDLSPRALATLRRTHGRGWYVAADCTRLPFRDGAFAQTVCSEVLEHVADDRAAICEMARVLEPNGAAAVTFPHRAAYFGVDDRFVHHFRRYEAAEMRERLIEAGFAPEAPRRVLGLLEKGIMVPTVLLVSRAFPQGDDVSRSPRPPRVVVALASIARLLNAVLVVVCCIEAAMIPVRWATVLLIKARRGPA